MLNDEVDCAEAMARSIVSSVWLRRRRTSGRNFRPASDNRIRWRMRSNRSTPNWLSRSLICRLTALWVRLSSCAACVKLPWRAAHSKACSVAMSGINLLLRFIPSRINIVAFVAIITAKPLIRYIFIIIHACSPQARHAIAGRCPFSTEIFAMKDQKFVSPDAIRSAFRQPCRPCTGRSACLWHPHGPRRRRECQGSGRRQPSA